MTPKLRLFGFTPIVALIVLPHLSSAVTLAPGDIVVVGEGIGGSSNDTGLLLVDPTTGNRTIISDKNTGTGPALMKAAQVAIEPNGDLLVVDQSYNGVIRVDPATGNRTLLTGGGVGTGPGMDQPLGVTELGGTIYVTAGTFTAASVFAVDPVTGNRSILSGQGVGTGPALFIPIGLATYGNSLFVIDELNLVQQVDTVTGNRIGGSPVGTYPPTGIGVTFSHDGTVLISGQAVSTNGKEGVYSANLATHTYTPISTGLIGTGPMLGMDGPTGIATEANGTILLNDATLNAVLSIDPTTGSRTILSDATHGTGPSFIAPTGILVVPSVPEPSSIALLAVGAAALAIFARRARR